jgi:hypothetical protein
MMFFGHTGFHRLILINAIPLISINAKMSIYQYPEQLKAPSRSGRYARSQGTPSEVGYRPIRAASAGLFDPEFTPACRTYIAVNEGAAVRRLK